MKVKDLIEELKKYPEDAPVKSRNYSGTFSDEEIQVREGANAHTKGYILIEGVWICTN